MIEMPTAFFPPFHPPCSIRRAHSVNLRRPALSVDSFAMTYDWILSANGFEASIFSVLF